MRLLVINTSWPSKQHPYLVFLFAHLKERFPNLQFFLFRKEADVRFAYELVGKTRVDDMLSDAMYRFAVRSNPIAYIKALFRILIHAKIAMRIFLLCLKDGYGVKEALGQLFYNNELLGKTYDLVYVNALQTARHYSIRSFFSKTKVVASSRGQDFDWNPTGYDKVLRDIDHLHVLGEYLKAKAVSRGFAPESVTIIPPAILPKGLKEQAVRLGEKEMLVMSSARLIWTKGFVYAIRAFALLKKSAPEADGWKYVILGDGPDREFIKAEISRLGLEHDVLLVGWVDQNTVNQWLGRASIYLLLSIEEGFNNSVMQAQSFGLPCIVSDAGGLPENVINGETGFVVRRYNSDVCADALRTLIVDESLRSRFGNRARSRMESEFGLSIQVGKYIEMFKNVERGHEQNSIGM